MHRSTLATLSLFLSFIAYGAAQTGKPPSSDKLFTTASRELNRALTELKKADPPPYFLSYSVSDVHFAVIAASNGALLSSTASHRRSADVQVRVGSPELDNTHNEHRASALTTVPLPLEDDTDAIARVLWITTDREYKKAAQTFLQVKTATEVRAKEDDDSPDFSKEQPQNHVESLPHVPDLDVHRLEEKARDYSAIFRKHPQVYRSSVLLTIQDTARRFISSEGTDVIVPNTLVRVVVIGETRADDGMELVRVETIDGTGLDKLPSDDQVRSRIEKLVTDLEQLRNAPVTEPFAGPAIFSGRAAAVFFHEVLGHRLEGQRQRGDQEGQTFTKQLNHKVLPEFISVSDDPTLRELSGTPLSGFYEFDDEGQPAHRVELVKNGILTNFLMSRLPVKQFSNSNGHGRSQPGLMPIGRQGNLIVSSTKSVSDVELRNLLIEQAKKQGKAYGLRFDEISGGSTLTTRGAPQVFQVHPVMVYRVYTDGRPDELVRGVNILGTPLAALERIVVTGNKTEIFDGECGAESGAIPVAAASPAMLISEIEVEKQNQGHTRPPILPPPGADEKTGGGQ